jgi:DNA-binding transcriptional ArsR family regulator
LTPEALQDVAATFGLLSATVRLHILWLLASGERDVGTLAAAVDQTVPTVSHHLAKLKLAGLVRARREGKRQVYVVDDAYVVDLVRLAFEHDRHHRDRPRRRVRGA